MFLYRTNVKLNAIYASSQLIRREFLLYLFTLFINSSYPSFYKGLSLKVLEKYGFY
jgi:hypothetical protein